MPANLPPPYFEAEKRYREAKTLQEKIEALEEMLTIMPKHKGTDRLRADLRKRIAKLNDESQQKKGGPKREAAYAVEKEGAVQVAIVGPPNVGKSSLVSVLTNAKPEIAEFPHSTRKPTPGMATFENIQIQLVDTPPVDRDFFDPWMADLMRRADMLTLMLDIHADPLQELDEIFVILHSLRIFHKGWPIPADLKKPPFIKNMLVVVNKVDSPEEDKDYDAFIDLSEVTLPCIPVSARTGRNLSEFLHKLYDLAEIIRVYTKAPGKGPNFNSPFVLPRESTLEELARKIHKDFVSKLKFAKIWGKSVFDGQMVQRDYLLQDGDIVEMHM